MKIITPSMAVDALNEVSDRAWSYHNIIYLLKHNQLKGEKMGWVWAVDADDLKKLIKSEAKATKAAKRSR